MCSELCSRCQNEGRIQRLTTQSGREHEKHQVAKHQRIAQPVSAVIAEERLQDLGMRGPQRRDSLGGRSLVIILSPLHGSPDGAQGLGAGASLRVVTTGRTGEQRRSLPFQTCLKSNWRAYFISRSNGRGRGQRGETELRRQGDTGMRWGVRPEREQ